jgi:hypothetical protein
MTRGAARAGDRHAGGRWAGWGAAHHAGAQTASYRHTPPCKIRHMYAVCVLHGGRGVCNQAFAHEDTVEFGDTLAGKLFVETIQTMRTAQSIAAVQQGLPGAHGVFMHFVWVNVIHRTHISCIDRCGRVIRTAGSHTHVASSTYDHDERAHAC